MPDLTIAILAGGQSRRMGFNKALVEIAGRPLIETLALRARAVGDEVVVCASDEQAYVFLHLPIVRDEFPGHGPAAGLHAAMTYSRRELILLVACDLPNAGEHLWRRMAASATGFDAVIPRTSDGRVHPLCAIYRRTCLSVLESNLRRNINKVTELFAEGTLRPRWLEGIEGQFQDSELENINTPEDLARLG